MASYCSVIYVNVFGGEKKWIRVSSEQAYFHCAHQEAIIKFQKTEQILLS